MKILAIDPATLTGWAVSYPSSTLSGVADFGAHRGNRPMIFEAFDLWLADMVTEHEPEMLVFETPIHRGSGSRTGFGLAAIIELIAARRGLFVAEVNLVTIKRHGTGNARAEKAAMVSAARARGWAPATDDEADALWLLDYAQVHLREAA